MLEKKNGGLILQTHEGEVCGRELVHSALVAMGLFRGQLHGEVCGRELDPQCFSGNGPFSRSTTCTTHYSPKKKRTTQWTKSASEMKSSWVVQPKFRSSGGLCTGHRCGIHCSKIDILQACNNGAGAATTVWE